MIQFKSVLLATAVAGLAARNIFMQQMIPSDLV